MAALVAALTVVLGCHHDKHDISYTPKEEVVMPPDQARFNEPPSAEYRKRPQQKDEKSLMGKDKIGGPMGGGF